MNEDGSGGADGKDEKRYKSPHGQGLTFSMEFFKDDPDEMQALYISQQLARLGQRKRYVIGVFSAIAYVLKARGSMPTAFEITMAIRELAERES